MSRPSTIVISDWLANCRTEQWTPFEAATALKAALAKEGYDSSTRGLIERTIRVLSRPARDAAEGADEPVVCDTNTFSRLAHEPPAIIPEGCSAPLDIQTAAEIEHERLARKSAAPHWERRSQLDILKRYRAGASRYATVEAALDDILAQSAPPRPAPDAMRFAVLSPSVIAQAYRDWAWMKKGEAVGNMLAHEAARCAFAAGTEWAHNSAPVPPADGASETEQEFEDRLLKQDARDMLRLIDFISDKIGLPHNEELSRENFSAWLAALSPSGTGAAEPVGESVVAVRISEMVKPRKKRARP